MSEFIEVNTFSLVANVPFDLMGTANLFALFQAPSVVTVEFFKNQTRTGIAQNALEGFRRGPLADGKEFDWVRVTSAVNQDVQICRALGEAALSRLAGAVTATVTKSTTGADEPDNVIAALGTFNIAANANRRTVTVASDPLNTGASLRISSTGGARGHFLQAGMSVTLDSAAAWKVYNPDTVATANIGVVYEKD